MVSSMNNRRPATGNQTALREANRIRILEAVKRYGGLSQVELAGATGLSAATVSNIVREMSTSGLLQTAQSIHSGRRAQRVTLSHGSGLVAAVHIEPRHLWAAVTDMYEKVLSEHGMPLARDHRADHELDQVSLLIGDMLESIEAQVDELSAVAVSLAAPIDLQTGMVANDRIMRGWAGTRIAESLSARLNKPVHVDNASNTIAMAEARHGAGRGVEDLVVVDVSDGVGAGIILRGSLLRGHHGTAGEFGHVPVTPNGAVCSCGLRGCLQTEAGGRAILDRLDRGVPMSLRDVVRSAEAGDPDALGELERSGRVIGRALAGLCSILDPERVVVTGDLAAAGDLLLGPMRAAMSAHLMVDSASAPELVTGQLGSRAALVGATMMAIDRSVAG